jgi:hypothetical protein
MITSVEVAERGGSVLGTSGAGSRSAIVVDIFGPSFTLDAHFRGVEHHIGLGKPLLSRQSVHQQSAINQSGTITK